MEFKNKNPKFYILSGKAGNGKNKVASYIEEIYKEKNIKVINLAYAAYLKGYAKNILNWDGNEQTKPREFLQQIGVELIKTKINSMMLVNRLIEDAKVYSYFYDVITISDARFPEEIETIKKLFDKVTVIHIHGLEGNNKLTIDERNHATEVALDEYTDYDYEIDNSGTLDKLKENVESIINEVERND